MRTTTLPRRRAAPAVRVPPSGARFSRPPLRRMMRLHGLLQEGRFPNCRRLAEELEVSAKTVQRDIDFMRDQLELPIGYSAAERGFFYTRPVVQFPSVQISEGELVALFVARRALEQYRGTSFEKPLRAAFEKLTAALPEQISFGWSELDAAVSFRAGTGGSGTTDVEVFKTVSQAVLRQQELEFDYRKPQTPAGKRADRRRVQGLHLGCIGGQWYLIGQDLVRAATRTFVLGRMAEVRNTGKRFTRPSGFSLDKLMADSFGVFSGLLTERVRLRFTPAVAALVRERAWHPSQKITDQPDGGAELTLEVGVSPEVERWVLSWGDDVEVLAPESLQNAVLARARRLLARTASAPD